MDDVLAQFAQLWMVAHCKCTQLRSWHSENHLDCYSIDPWIVEQFKEIVNQIVPPRIIPAVKIDFSTTTINEGSSQIPKLSLSGSGSEDNLATTNFTESLDSLQESDTITFDKLSFLPRSRGMWQ